MILSQRAKATPPYLWYDQHSSSTPRTLSPALDITQKRRHPSKSKIYASRTSDDQKASCHVTDPCKPSWSYRRVASSWSHSTRTAEWICGTSMCGTRMQACMLGLSAAVRCQGRQRATCKCHGGRSSSATSPIAKLLMSGCADGGHAFVKAFFCSEPRIPVQVIFQGI